MIAKQKVHEFVCLDCHHILRSRSGRYEWGCPKCNGPLVRMDLLNPDCHSIDTWALETGEYLGKV